VFSPSGVLPGEGDVELVASDVSFTLGGASVTRPNRATQPTEAMLEPVASTDDPLPGDTEPHLAPDPAGLPLPSPEASIDTPAVDDDGDSVADVAVTDQYPRVTNEAKVAAAAKDAANNEDQAADDDDDGPAITDKVSVVRAAEVDPFAQVADLDDDDEDGGSTTTLILDRNSLKDVLAGKPPPPPDAPPDGPPDAPQEPPTKTARIKVSGMRRKLTSARTDCTPENEVLSAEVILRSSEAQANSSPLVFILVVLIVVGTIVAILLFAGVLKASQTPWPASTSESSHIIVTQRDDSPLLDMAVSPEGHTYATCTAHTLEIWSAARGQRQLLDRASLDTLACHKLAFSQNATEIFVVDPHGQLGRFKRSDRSWQTLAPIAGKVASLRVLNNDALLWQGAEDTSTWFYRNPGGETQVVPLPSPERETSAPMAACSTQDSDSFALFQGTQLWVLEPASGDVKHTLEADDVIMGCSLSADGARAALLVAGIGVQHWRVDEPRPLAQPFPDWATLAAGQVPVSMTFGADDERLLIHVRDRVLSVQSRFLQLDGAAVASDGANTALTLPLPGARAALLLREGQLEPVGLDDGERVAGPTLPSLIHQASVFTPSGHQVLSYFIDAGSTRGGPRGPGGRLMLWDLESMTQVVDVRISDLVKDILVTPDSEQVVLVIEHAANEHRLHSLKLADLTQISVLDLGTYVPVSLAWNGSGRFLLTTDRVGQSRLFAHSDGFLAPVDDMRITPQTPAALMRDALLVQWFPNDGLRIFDLETGQRTSALLKPDVVPETASIRRVVAHPQSHALVLLTRSRALWVRLATTAQPRIETRWIDLPTTDGEAVFSNDGSRFWLGDGVFDSNTGARLTTLKPRLHGTPFPANASLSADLTSLYATDAEGGRWRVDTGAWSPSVPLHNSKTRLHGTSTLQHPSGEWLLQGADGSLALIGSNTSHHLALTAFDADRWAMASA